MAQVHQRMELNRGDFSFCVQLKAFPNKFPSWACRTVKNTVLSLFGRSIKWQEDRRVLMSGGKIQFGTTNTEPNGLQNKNCINFAARWLKNLSATTESLLLDKLEKIDANK